MYFVWFRFRLLRSYLAYRPDESARIGRLLDLVGGGAPGHGPLHLLDRGAAKIGFRWCVDGFCWDRLGLPRLPVIEGPTQHLKSAIVDFLEHCIPADLSSRKGFRGGPFLDYPGSMHLLDSSHVRGRDKALPRGILSGRVWNGFLLGKVRRESVPCRVCGGVDGMGNCSGSVHLPLWFMLGRVLSSAVLLIWTRLAGLGVSFGMVGCLLFLVVLWVTLGRVMLLILLRTSWRLHLVRMLELIVTH